jgi:hypothetical protein
MKMVLWSGVLATLVTGCSSSGDLGSFSSSLDSQRTVAGLSTDERKTLCDEMTAFYSRSGTAADLSELDCRANSSVGIHEAGDTSQTDADVRGACQEEYDRCEASSDPNAGSCSLPTGCPATVAEVAACVNDISRWTAGALAATPTCDTLTVAKLEARGNSNPEPPLPASCLALAQKCPDAAIPAM